MDRALKLDQLIDGAEELLTNLADAHNPDVQRLRDRVDHAIRDARRSFASETGEASHRLHDIARSVDDYVRDYPWLALGAGVVLAGAATFLTGYLIGSKRSPGRRPARRPR